MLLLLSTRRICAVFFSIISTLTVPALSQLFVEPTGLCDQLAVDSNDLPPPGQFVEEPLSSNRYRVLINAIRRTDRATPRFRISTFAIICTSRGTIEGRIASLSAFLLIDCQFCKDDEVTRRTRHILGFYEYQVIISAYCFRQRGSLQIPQDMPYEFRNLNSRGEEIVTMIRPGVTIGPPQGMIPARRSSGCAICADNVKQAEINLAWDAPTWCYTCPERCRNPDGSLECVGTRLTDCCRTFFFVENLQQNQCIYECNTKIINGVCQEGVTCLSSDLSGDGIARMTAFGRLLGDRYIEGTLVQLECATGRYQRRIDNVTCSSNAAWIPSPATFCTLIFRNVSLSSIIPPINCPGEILQYGCTVVTNSDTFVPIAVAVTLSSGSTRNLSIDFLNMPIELFTMPLITATLTDFDSSRQSGQVLIELHVDDSVTLTGTAIQCYFENVMDSVIITANVPESPSRFEIGSRYYGRQTVTISLSWDEAQSSSIERVADEYVLLFMPSSFPPFNITTTSFTANASLLYNTVYNISLRGVNCAGSGPAALLPNIIFVNCSDPTPPINGSILNITGTTLFTTAIYACNSGFRPSAIQNSSCLATANWTPDPEIHMCTEIRVIISLAAQRTARDNIVCPNDVITYNCSIQTNSEMIDLTWLILMPGMPTVSVNNLNGAPDLMVPVNASSGVRATLTRFILDEYIESTIELTVTRSMNLNGTVLQCASGNQLESITVLVDLSVPLPPTNFRASVPFFSALNYSVTFEWNAPEGNGVEIVVTDYRLYISSLSLSSTSSIVVINSTVLNITLDYNEEYEVNLTATNCIGESDIVTLPNFIYISCGYPKPPTNGTFDAPNNTRVGARVNFRCDDGFRPSTTFMSTCEITALWTPAPQNHTCTYIRATVTVTSLPRPISRQDIECPGDTIPYMCSVQSNSEMAQLEWVVTFPGQNSTTILFMNNSNLNISVNLPMNVTSILTEYVSDRFVESVIVLTVLSNVSMNGTLLECRSEDLASVEELVFVDSLAPLLPIGFNLTEVTYTVKNVTITFKWTPPQGEGSQVVVDYYLLSVYPIPLSHPITVNISGSLLSWDVTIEYNRNYSANITAVNCAGDSEAAVFPEKIEFVNCGLPEPPVNGTVDSPDHTREGASVDYRCDNGFRPSPNFTSTCESTALWTPPPESHNCTFVIAMVTITALQRNVSREDIECPGDTIPYRCSVQSNSETVQLNWMITFPGQATIIMVVYTNDSSRNAVTFLPMNLTARLTQYEVDQNVESELELTVLQGVPMNGTILECRSEELASKNETVYVNTAEPLLPSGFSIAGQRFTISDVAVTFAWNEPVGSGPEAVVDNYIVTITPNPLFPFADNTLPNSPRSFNVTLHYNTTYGVSITAENCAGQSPTFTLPNFQYINCGVPEPPVNGTIYTSAHTREGATVDYRCNDGFRPSANFTATCENTTVWNPLPQDHICTFIDASITLAALERITSRQDIECPGDTIPYRCSISSNSEMVQLRWLVTFPGQDTIMILYTNRSTQNTVDYLEMNATSSLIRYTKDEFIESEIVLTVLHNVSMNGTLLICESEDLARMATVVYVNTSVPLIPLGFNITKVAFSVKNATLTFEWIPLQGEGPEVVVDYYLLSVYTIPLSQPIIAEISGSLLSWNVTIEYNRNYSANITAVNCAGDSEAAVFPEKIEFVNCGLPEPPVNGTVDSPDHTREGASVDYRCDNGFRPSRNFTSTCANTALWTPPPESHNCTFVIAMVTITALQRDVSREDIECPGDTIPYRCSVQSNSETVQLNWMITFPGQDTIIMVVYTNDSSRNAVTFLPMNLTARLTQYEVDQNVESELELTVLQGVPMNGTILECRSEELASKNETVYVNTAEPLQPSGFSIAGQRFTISDVTVTFSWNEALRSGPETVVDNYIVTVTPNPLFPFAESTLPNSPRSFNVTLHYNTTYGVSITAENCAGLSPTFTLPNFQYINCGVPEPPVNGTVYTSAHTREGATVDYRCNDGFRPSATFIATCENTTVWSPLPQGHICTFIVANITLLSLNRIVSRDDIECPGDIIPFQCAVESNSENIVLEWLVTFPEQAPLTMTYTNFSATETVDFLGMNVTTVVTNNGRGDFIESVLVLTILQNVSMNGTQIECSSADLDSEIAIVYVNALAPNTPSGLNIFSEQYFHTLDNTTITVSWVAPQGSGMETMVDMYHLFISPEPLSRQAFTVVYGTAINVTIQNNRLYNISIQAVNCAGESSLLVLPSVEIIDCGAPEPPLNGFLGNYSTKSGDNVTFQCSMGYIPSAVFSSTCDSQGMWTPAPYTHTCTLVTATVTLDFLGATKALEEIDCPGDTVSLNCSVQSNTETLHLSWSVEIPDFPPIGITYHYNNMSSISHENLLDMNISTRLLALREGFLESVITIVVLDARMNRTTVTCGIADLDAETKEILVNTSEPTRPVNFNISGTLESARIEVLFEWDTPLGMGPEFFIQSYSIFVKSDSEFYSSDATPGNTTAVFTLNYNVNYTAFAVAVNCAGESEPFILDDIFFVDCGIPTSPANASSKGNLTRTTPGAVVTFKCDPFFLPTIDLVSECLSGGNWYPPPESHICLLDDRRTSPINISLGAVTSLLPLLILIIIAVVAIILLIGFWRKYKRGTKPYGSETVSTTDEDALVAEAKVQNQDKARGSSVEIKHFLSSLEHPLSQKVLFPSHLPPLDLRRHYFGRYPAPLMQHSDPLNMHRKERLPASLERSASQPLHHLPPLPDHYITKLPSLEVISLEEDSSKEKLEQSHTPEQITPQEKHLHSISRLKKHSLQHRLSQQAPPDLPSLQPHLPSVEKLEPRRLPSLDHSPLKRLPSPSIQHPSSLPQPFQTSSDQQLTPTHQPVKINSFSQQSPTLKPQKHSTDIKHPPSLQTVKHSPHIQQRRSVDKKLPDLQPVKESSETSLDEQPPVFQFIKHSPPVYHLTSRAQQVHDRQPEKESFETSLDKQPPVLHPTKHSPPGKKSSDTSLDKQPPILHPMTYSPPIHHQTSFDKQSHDLQPGKKSSDTSLDKQPPVFQLIKHSPPVYHLTSCDKQFHDCQPGKESSETSLDKQPPVLHPTKHSSPVHHRTSFDKQSLALSVEQSRPVKQETSLVQQPSALQPEKHSPPVQHRTSFDKQSQPVEQSPPAQYETFLDQQPHVFHPVKHSPPVQHQTPFHQQPSDLQPEEHSPPIWRQASIDKPPLALQPAAHPPPVELKEDLDQQSPTQGEPLVEGASSVAKWAQEILDYENEQSPIESQAQKEEAQKEDMNSLQSAPFIVSHSSPLPPLGASKSS